MKKYVVDVLDNKIYFFLAIAGLLLVILMLTPLLNSGFVSDDSFQSFTKGTLSYNHQTLVGFSYNVIRSWLLDEGRFVPLSVAYMYAFFSMIDQNVFIYKLFILFFVAINVLTFGYFIKLITGSRSLSLLSILMAPLFFQIRVYHDPVVSFHLLMQLVFLCFILSIIFLVVYLRTGEKKYLISSLLLYLLNLLTYELSYPFIILYFLIIYFHSCNKGLNHLLKLSAPFIFLSLLCISIPFISRIYLGIPLFGVPEYTAASTAEEAFKSIYVPNLDAKEYIITLAKQTTAAFPLSYPIVHYLTNPSRIQSDLNVLFSGITIIIAGLYFLLYLIISKTVEDELFVKQKIQFNVKFLSIFGLFLLILPGVLVALSPKYQHELSWGTGYLPVYISYFGLMIIAICTIYAIYGKIYANSKAHIFAMSLILALIFSLTGSITYTCNVGTFDDLNDAWLYPREILDNGLKDGLFKFVPDGAILLTDPSHLWDQPGFYLMNSGVKLGYVGNKLLEGYISDKLPAIAFQGNYSNKLSYNFSDVDDVFYLRYFSRSGQEGYAVLGRVKDLLVSKETLDHVTVDHIYIYIHHDSDPHQKEHISVKDIYAYDSRLQAEPICIGEINSSPIYSGKHWELYLIVSENLLIDAQSFYIDETKLDGGSHDVFYKDGWYDQENWNGNLAHWMNNDSQIILHSNNDTQGILSFQTLSFYRPRTLEVYYGDELVTQTPVSTCFTNVSIPIRLIKGSNIVRFHVPEGCEKPSDKLDFKNSDSRCLSIAVQNMVMREKGAN